MNLDNMNIFSCEERENVFKTFRDDWIQIVCRADYD